MSITLVALKIWPSFSAFSLSSDNLCFKQVEEREPIHVQFNSDKFPENARPLNIWEGRSAGKFGEIKWTPGLDSTNPRLIFQFRELRIDIHQMFVHPVKISVFIKPLKIKESSGGRSQDARGPLCCCGWAGGVSVSQWLFVSSWIIPLSHDVLWWPRSQLGHGSGQHLEPGHHSSPAQAGAGNEHKICSWGQLQQRARLAMFRVRSRVTEKEDTLWRLMWTGLDSIWYPPVTGVLWDLTL